MAIVGNVKTSNRMPLIMDLDTPSNADVVKQMLRESEAINLYPTPEVDPVEEFTQSMGEMYDKLYEASDAQMVIEQNRQQFLHETKADLLSLALYQNLIAPVQETQLATSREKDLALNAVANFVNEEGTDLLLDTFRYKNVYLAEIAHCVDEEYERILETVEGKIKEGLPEDDICEIEDKDIKKYLVDCDNKVPKDVTNIIHKRVEGAITDFVDDKKRSQFKIKQIYDKAREKVDQYNQAQQAMDMANQTDAGMDGSVDPEVSIDANLNAKLDAQNQEDIMNQAEPGYDPTAIGANSGVGLQSPQQEAMAWAKSMESQVLEESYNVFDAMVRVLVESAHKTEAIKMQYLKESTNQIDFEKVFKDTRALYTVLESLNTIGAIEANQDYLKRMIMEMYEDSEACSDQNAK